MRDFKKEFKTLEHELKCSVINLAYKVQYNELNGPYCGNILYSDIYMSTPTFVLKSNRGNDFHLSAQGFFGANDDTRFYLDEKNDNGFPIQNGIIYGSSVLVGEKLKYPVDFLIDVYTGLCKFQEDLKDITIINMDTMIKGIMWNAKITLPTRFKDKISDGIPSDFIEDLKKAMDNTQRIKDGRWYKSDILHDEYVCKKHFIKIIIRKK